MSWISTWLFMFYRVRSSQCPLLPISILRSLFFVFPCSPRVWIPMMSIHLCLSSALFFATSNPLLESVVKNKGESMWSYPVDLIVQENFLYPHPSCLVQHVAYCGGLSSVTAVPLSSAIAFPISPSSFCVFHMWFPLFFLSHSFVRDAAFHRS